MPFLKTFISHPLEQLPDALVRSRAGMPIVAGTVGEAVEVASQYFGVKIVPHDPPKFFRVYGMPDATAEDYKLVDIHIQRDRQEICIKQDLSFALLESDEVLIGMLAC